MPSIDIARTAWLSAGLPETVPGVTIDRQCGSSQQAAHFAAQGVIAGAYDIVYLLARALTAGGPDRRALRDYLAQVGRARAAFEGVTGTISFDDRGDVAGKSVVVGVVRGGRLVSEATQ